MRDYFLVCIYTTLRHRMYSHKGGIIKIPFVYKIYYTLNKQCTIIL